MTQNAEYSGLPPAIQQVHWKIDKVEDDLEKETTDRKDTDKVMFEKFDKLNNMIICQLGAAILTLVVVIAMFIIR